MPSIGELFIELGVVGDPEQVEKFNKKIKETAKSMDLTVKSAVKTNNGLADLAKGFAAAVTAIVGAGIALNKFTNDLVKNNQAMLDLTRTTDIAQGTFQKWNNIGKMLGVENAAQQLEGLNQRMFELMLTGEGARGFQLAGINPVGQDANSVLEQLRSRVSGMDDTTATYLLQQMGLDPKMLHLLRLSRQEFDELGATVRKYQLTPEQTKQIQAMNVQLQIAAIKLQYLKDRAILAIMPYWVKFMQSLAGVVEMLARAGKEIGKFIVKWRGLVAGVIIGLSSLKPVQMFFANLSETFGQLITKIPIFGRAFAALGGIFARVLWPLTALYLLLDDIAVYMEGGDSVIGMLLNYTDAFIEDFKNLFKGFAEGNPLAPLIKALTDLSNLKIKPPPIIESLIAAGAAITVIVQQMANLKKKWDTDGTLTGGAAPLIGYSGELPDLSSMFITPAMQQNVRNNNSNTVTNNDNKVSMTNYIQTSQPAFDIQNQLNQTRFAMGNAIV